MPRTKSMVQRFADRVAATDAGAPSEWDAFLARGEWTPSSSEHILAVRYVAAEKRLHIRYASKARADNGGGSYYPVKPEQALDFARGGFRNSWVWDHLRLRGTKHGHRVSYRPEAFA